MILMLSHNRSWTVGPMKRQYIGYMYLLLKSYTTRGTE